MGVFGADHEAYLSGGVGGHGGIGVPRAGEDVPTGLEHVGDEVQIEPLALSLRGNDASGGQHPVHGGVEGGGEEGRGGSNGIAQQSICQLLLMWHHIWKKWMYSIVGQARSQENRAQREVDSKNTQRTTHIYI